MRRLIMIAYVLIVLVLNTPRIAISQEHSFRVFRQDGVTISETGGRNKYAEPIFSYESILQLEQDPSNLESLLYRPGRFVHGPDGHYYVIDRGNHRIVVFDDSGRYMRSFGGESFSSTITRTDRSFLTKR